MTRVLLVPDLPIERWPSMDRYASRLVAHLPRPPELDIAVAGKIARLTEDVPARESRTSGALESSLVPSGISELDRYVERYITYPFRVRRQAADVLHVLDHSYAHMVPARSGRPAVVTVHDLLPLITLRERSAGLRARGRKFLLERVLDGLRRARAWIVGTEWMRGELAAWLKREDGLHVIPFGVDDAFFEQPAESRAQTRERWGIPHDRFVLLHVGSVTNRKNIPGVLATAYGLRARGLPVWLLQVGDRFTDAQSVEIRSRDLGSVITQVGATTEPDLRAAYRAADVLLFPSHYEGFGLPLLEAMASGLPIVTSGAAALAEVAGDAAAVIEGRDPDRYVAAVARVAEDDAWARDLAGRGRERARRFTWSETARRTAEVYRTVA